MKDLKGIDNKKVYLITGAAGFIGFHLSKSLLDKGCKVVGYDIVNDYYDVELKEERLEILEEYNSFTFIKGDLDDEKKLEKVFIEYKPNYVVNLAGQAGVRYSIENPRAYIKSNIVGFFNILEMCRYYKVDHLLYASSSSVYGMNESVPFSEDDKCETPVSLYAATKKTDELMAYSYSKLYNIPTTGLRFFTVYGPYGRPDMAYYSFTNAIIEGRTIKVFNNGDMYRDFTYVGDIVEGIERMLCNPTEGDKNNVRAKVYNIGNHQPEKIMNFIEILEKHIGKEAKKEFYPMQPGDVYRTYADITHLMEDYDFKPNTSLDDGLKKFINWYKKRYNINI